VKEGRQQKKGEIVNLLNSCRKRERYRFGAGGKRMKSCSTFQEKGVWKEVPEIGSFRRQWDKRIHKVQNGIGGRRRKKTPLIR